MNICMMSVMMSSSFNGKSYSLENILETAAECGMKAIDWIGLHGVTAGELKRVTESAGMPVAGHTMLKGAFINDDPDYMEEFKRSLDDACLLNAPILMLPPFPRVNQSSLADDRRRYIDYYGQAEELARKAGVQLTLESTGYGNSPIVTADECLEVLNAVPGLKVTFDAGNVFTAEDPLEAFLKLRSYVVNFHMKDWFVSSVEKPGYLLKRSGKYLANAMIGDGAMKLRELWQAATAEERELWVNPESCDFTRKSSPREAFAEICRRMREWES